MCTYRSMCVFFLYSTSIISSIPRSILSILMMLQGRQQHGLFCSSSQNQVLGRFGKLLRPTARPQMMPKRSKKLL